MTLGKGLESLIPQKNNQQNIQSNPQVGGQQSGAANQQRDFNIQPVNNQNQPLLINDHCEAIDENLKEEIVIKPENIVQHHKKHQDAIFHIEVEKIKSNPYQPRKNFDEESLKELAASIREFGILQPLIILKIDKETENGTDVEYQLVAGERRLMAAKMIGLERVPAIIKRLANKTDQMEIAIVENLQRQNLDPIETARAYARLSDEFGLTQREIAQRLSKSRETIANALRLLNLPTEIQDALAYGKINESQARIILSIDDLGKQISIFKDLLANNLSVRELKNRIRNNSNNQKSEEGSGHQLPPQTDPEIHHFQEQLEEILGAPVKIEQHGEKGKIVISFYSPEEIEGIIKKLQLTTLN